LREEDPKLYRDNSAWTDSRQPSLGDAPAVRIAIVGEYREDFPPLAATETAVEHSARGLGLTVEITWLATDRIRVGDPSSLEPYHGFWIAPGSPYRALDGALWAIELARTAGRPLLGTCAGFQHMVLEFARNVLGWEEAVSEQYSPAGRHRVVHRLECVVRGKELSLRLEAGSRVASLYGASIVSERYFCTFGLNPAYREAIVAAGLEASGVDATSGEVRVVERGGPGFFLGTLFVPQMRSTARTPHPVVTGFLRAAAAELP
jgi:CTP synthase (UTP-ammonia lyase)